MSFPLGCFAFIFFLIHFTTRTPLIILYFHYQHHRSSYHLWLLLSAAVSISSLIVILIEGVWFCMSYLHELMLYFLLQSSQSIAVKGCGIGQVKWPAVMIKGKIMTVWGVMIKEIITDTVVITIWKKNNECLVDYNKRTYECYSGYNYPEWKMMSGQVIITEWDMSVTVVMVIQNNNNRWLNHYDKRVYECCSYYNLSE